ncbi:MAG: hypothetical protein AAGJ86_12870 [Pseudomonadota bacterium]
MKALVLNSASEAIAPEVKKLIASATIHFGSLIISIAEISLGVAMISGAMPMMLIKLRLGY